MTHIFSNELSPSGVAPSNIPVDYEGKENLIHAYLLGWGHGHGIACHNVPSIGKEYWTEAYGNSTADAETVRDIHADLCHQVEGNSRQFSPFEFIAHEFNTSEFDAEGKHMPDREGTTELLWDAFDSGTQDAIAADLATYGDADYGIGE